MAILEWAGRRFPMALNKRTGQGGLSLFLHFSFSCFFMLRPRSELSGCMSGCGPTSRNGHQYLEEGRALESSSQAFTRTRILPYHAFKAPLMAWINRNHPDQLHLTNNLRVPDMSHSFFFQRISTTSSIPAFPRSPVHSVVSHLLAIIYDFSPKTLHSHPRPNTSTMTKPTTIQPHSPIESQQRLERLETDCIKSYCASCRRSLRGQITK